jgi:hypothetical protein
MAKGIVKEELFQHPVYQELVKVIAREEWAAPLFEGMRSHGHTQCARALAVALLSVEYDLSCFAKLTDREIIGLQQVGNTKSETFQFLQSVRMVIQNTLQGSK